MSDLDTCSTSVDSDTEGSLADFIEHDEEEDEDEEFEMDEETDNGSTMHETKDEMDEETDNGTMQSDEKDDDADVRAQYNQEMEQQGLITTETGLRRSARANKGRAPVRYVDEDYIGLMISDVDSDMQWSSDEGE